MNTLCCLDTRLYKSDRENRHRSSSSLLGSVRRYWFLPARPPCIATRPARTRFNPYSSLENRRSNRPTLALLVDGARPSIGARCRSSWNGGHPRCWSTGTPIEHPSSCPIIPRSPRVVRIRAARAARRFSTARTLTPPPRSTGSGDGKYR